MSIHKLRYTLTRLTRDAEQLRERLGDDLRLTVQELKQLEATREALQATEHTLWKRGPSSAG